MFKILKLLLLLSVILLTGCIYKYSDDGNIKHNTITTESWVLVSPIQGEYYWKKVYDSHDDYDKAMQLIRNSSAY